MHPRARRAISVALSIALHALLLLEVWRWSIAVPVDGDPAPMRVTIVEPRSQRGAPRPVKPKQAPPPQVAQVEPPQVEPPKVEVPPVEVPPEVPPPQPEKKLPLPEQIVQPPDEGKNEVPPDTRFQSDRDVKVEKQQVKRGEPKPGESAPGEAAPLKPVPAPRKPAAPAKPAPASQRPGGGKPRREPPPRLASLPKLDRLMPDALALAREGYGQPAPPQPRAAPQTAPRQLAGGNDGLFLPTGPIGTLDYLPDIREGNITLLNTKAELNAPFVRRVALRVFQNWWIALKREITGAGLTTEEAVEAEAVMDPQGEMISFRITRRSPRIALGIDRRLQAAANVAFFDRNPPPGARSDDGNIHFVFAAEIRAVASPRGPMYFVQLGTGLR